MIRFAVFLACLAVCYSHGVLPVVPAVHAAPPLAPYPAYYGYTGLIGHGLHGNGLYGHGLVGKPLVHHLLKRSPHIVAPWAHVAPVAVSHQSRVDLHAPLAASVLPVFKPVVAPYISTPLLQKSLVAAPYYSGIGHYGNVYPHLAHSYY